MANISFVNPWVEGSRGLKVSRGFDVQADVAVADIADITESDFAEYGIRAGDIVHLTFTDATLVSDLYKIPVPFGALLKYTPA